MSPNKNFDKLNEKPPRKDITFDELKSGLESYGFVVARINGSHCIFKYPLDSRINNLVIPKPHGGSNTVNRVYIKELQDRIEEIENGKKENK